jgi:hypothetical protein
MGHGNSHTKSELPRRRIGAANFGPRPQGIAKIGMNAEAAQRSNEQQINIKQNCAECLI